MDTFKKWCNHHNNHEMKRFSILLMTICGRLCLKWASCWDGWGERSCPRSATAICPIFGGPKIFVKTIYSNFLSNYICHFVLVQPTFFSQTLSNGRENFRIDVFTILIDQLESYLEFRCNAYKNTCDTFGVIDKLHGWKCKRACSRRKETHWTVQWRSWTMICERLVDFAVYFKNCIRCEVIFI